MSDPTKIAAATLLQVYADIDLLALELCGDRLPFAPTAEARKELMRQIGEEVIHFSLQERTLERLGRPFEPVMSLSCREEIKTWFSGLDWYDFLAGLQLGIEGIGIAVVERVSAHAGPIVRESLRIPIADEHRQSSVGMRESQVLLSRSTPAGREELRGRILGVFEQVYLLAEKSLPVPFEECWNELGLTKADLWETVRERTRSILEKVGFEPALPASFVA